MAPKDLETPAEAARQVPMAEVLEMLGKDAGTGQTGQIHCPIHEDRHPSARLYAEDNRLYCSTCQTLLDPIGLVQRTLGLGFAESITWLEGAFDLTLHVSGLTTLVRASLKRTRPHDPTPMVRVLDAALRAARSRLSCEAYSKAATAIDLMLYQVTQGILSGAEFATHAATLLGTLHDHQ